MMRRVQVRVSIQRESLSRFRNLKLGNGKKGVAVQQFGTFGYDSKRFLIQPRFSKADCVAVTVEAL